MPPLTRPNASSVAATKRAKSLVVEDPSSRELLDRIRAVAPSDGTVLVAGETGTGKELVARRIHELSARAEQPFLTVSCAALSETLAASELFGQEQESPSGVVAAKAGWFEAADGGTLLLDEIADLPLTVQAKLLRVLQEREIVRVGSHRARAVDVRLIVTTNVELKDAVLPGHFREDLFHRLNVVTLQLLPLRERARDILPLARHFVELYSERLGVPAAELGPDATARLLEHRWPGNIRELENVIHNAVLLCSGPQISPRDLRLTTLQPAVVARPAGGATRSLLDEALLERFEQGGPHLYERIEEAVMRAAYRYCENNQLQTARLLGISRNIVRARLIQFGEIPGTLRGSRQTDVASRTPAESPRLSTLRSLEAGACARGLGKGAASARLGRRMGGVFERRRAGGGVSSRRRRPRHHGRGPACHRPSRARADRLSGR
jgi:sigma-54-specific transcriptional regulator